MVLRISFFLLRFGLDLCMDMCTFFVSCPSDIGSTLSMVFDDSMLRIVTFILYSTTLRLGEVAK